MKKNRNCEDDSEIHSIVVEQPPKIKPKPSTSAAAQATSGASTRPKELHSKVSGEIIVFLV